MCNCIQSSLLVIRNLISGDVFDQGISVVDDKAITVSLGFLLGGGIGSGTFDLQDR